MQWKNEFFNDVLMVDALPDAFEVEYTSLDKSYRTYSLVNTTIFFGLFSVVLCLVMLFSGQLNSLMRVLGFLAVLVLLYAVRMVIKYYGYGKKGYAIRRYDVLYKSGIWWKRHVFVPKNRIQHVEIKKTPLEDVFGISRLLIFTAGGSGSDLVIPGLLPEVSERIKTNLMLKVVHDQEE